MGKRGLFNGTELVSRWKGANDGGNGVETKDAGLFGIDVADEAGSDIEAKQVITKRVEAQLVRLHVPTSRVICPIGSVQCRVSSNYESRRVDQLANLHPIEIPIGC